VLFRKRRIGTLGLIGALGLTTDPTHKLFFCFVNPATLISFRIGRSRTMFGYSSFCHVAFEWKGNGRETEGVQGRGERSGSRCSTIQTAPPFSLNSLFAY